MKEGALAASAENCDLRLPRSEMNLWRAWFAIAVHTFQRQWRVRQMGWAALGILVLTVLSVSLVGRGRGGWGIAERNYRQTGVTYSQTAQGLLYPNRFEVGGGPLTNYRSNNPFPAKDSRVVDLPLEAHLLPRPWDPVADSVQSLLLAVPAAVMKSEKFRADWALMNFSRWVVLGSYLGFVLPLITLAYATSAIGAERESRSLVWLLSRPVPRSAVYLATFVGVLPWCLLFGGVGFAALCLAGGDVGRQALAIYWPSALAGTVALAALFHLFGALFSRPIVVGLVYVFFYEALVAALPGSLKKLSIAFYSRSLMHDEAIAAGVPGAMLDISGPVSQGMAWAVLVLITAVVTTLGMWRFARAEQRDDV